MRPVRLVWQDATTDDEASQPVPLCERDVVAWLIEEREDRVVVAMDITTWENGDVAFSHLYTIPRRLVRSMTFLEGADA